MIHDRTPSEYFNRFYYSNTGYYLLGMIVEAATVSTVADSHDVVLLSGVRHDHLRSG